MEKTGIATGVIGGIGLGLLIGSELSGTYITLLGAILLIISILSTATFSYMKK